MTIKKTKLIVFNWKMNPNSLKEAKRLLNSILNPKSYILNSKKIELVICPPFIYLSDFFGLINETKLKLRLKLGAQDAFYKEKGAYTGEISPKMLKDLGVEYVIIGHSERRQHLKETDEMINKKILAALKAKLKVVLCIGEDLKIRKKGKKAIENFIKNQLQKGLMDIYNLKPNTQNLIIAYEPIWAIGTGLPATPEDALEMIKFIKSFVVGRLSLVVPVLYGGSVDGKNIKDFIKYKQIDGALVGGASLKPDEIKKIIKISSRR